MAESDLDYLRRRSAEEARRAHECTDRLAADVHRRMALLYEDRVAALTDNPEFDPIIHSRQPT